MKNKNLALLLTILSFFSSSASFAMDRDDSKMASPAPHTTATPPSKPAISDPDYYEQLGNIYAGSAFILENVMATEQRLLGIHEREYQKALQQASALKYQIESYKLLQ